MEVPMKKDFDLSERGEGLSTEEVWGVEEMPVTFEALSRVDRLLANRMAWILEQEERARQTLSSAERSYVVAFAADELVLAHKQRESAKAAVSRAEKRRRQAEADVEKMFCIRNFYRSYDIFMLAVQRARKLVPS